MKVKVQHEGKTIEVDLPEGWVPPEVAVDLISKDHVENIVKSRLAQAKKGAKSELLEDEEFRGEALKAWKITPAKPGAGEKDVEKAVAEALAEYEKKNVAPTKAELEATKGKLAKFQQKTKAARLMEAARLAGFEDHFLEVPPNGAEPVVATLFGNMFAEDPESDEIFARNPKGDGFAISGKKDRTHPWQTPEDYFGDLRTNKSFARYFKDRSQQGPGSRPAQGKGSGEAVIDVDTSDPTAIARFADRIVAGTATVRTGDGQ